MACNIACAHLQHTHSVIGMLQLITVSSAGMLAICDTVTLTFHCSVRPVSFCTKECPDLHSLLMHQKQHLAQGIMINWHNGAEFWKFMLTVGSRVVNRDISSPLVAIALLFGSFFVINTHYPADTSIMFEFIQRYVLICSYLCIVVVL